jgi:TRAP-type C4-dicarboxylate transport system substrate-binding protein
VRRAATSEQNQFKQQSNNAREEIMRSRNRTTLLLAAAIGLLVTTTLTAEAQQIKLKFSSFEPPTAALTARVMTPWAAEVSKASGGNLQIDMYPGGILGRNPLTQLKLVQDGVADIAWIVLAYTPGRFDDADVVGLPFSTDNATEATAVLTRMFARNELAGFDDLKVLALAATPPVKIHATSPILAVADMKGKRVRATGDILVKTVNRLGGVPVTLGGGQVAESLSRGVVDATLNNWGFVADFKVNEVTSNHLIVPLGSVAVMIAMRKEKFDALPAATKELIEKHSGDVFSRRLAAVFDEIEHKYAEDIGKSGKNRVVAPSAAELESWKTGLHPVVQEWREATPRNEKIYQSFSAELAKHRAGQ